VKNEPLNQPTKEMVDFFHQRTDTHIRRVQKYAVKLAYEFDMLAELIRVVKLHDLSKYDDPEYLPYVYLTWIKKCQKDGVDFEADKSINDKVLWATTRHLLSNAHHPEFWSDNRDPINPNRDKPKELIDATSMPILYLGEMVADWSAMAEEFNQEGPYKWAQDNINVRWKFTEKQVKVIYEFIDFLWKDM